MTQLIFVRIYSRQAAISVIPAAGLCFARPDLPCFVFSRWTLRYGEHARTEDAIKCPRLGSDTSCSFTLRRDCWQGLPWWRKGKRPWRWSVLINSVCGHAVCIHAVGKNAGDAGSFKPTRVIINTVKQPTAAGEIFNCLAVVEFLCKISTMYKGSVCCSWCCVGEGYSSCIWVGQVFYMCCWMLNSFSLTTFDAVNHRIFLSILSGRALSWFEPGMSWQGRLSAPRQPSIGLGAGASVRSHCFWLCFHYYYTSAII